MNIERNRIEAHRPCRREIEGSTFQSIKDILDFLENIEVKAWNRVSEDWSVNALAALISRRTGKGELLH